MANELKPCPFCGSKWTGVRYMNNPFDEHHIYGGYAAYCDDCCCTTNRFKTKEEAIEAWNRRATVDAVEVAEMREFAQDVVYQFGYYCQHEGRLHITHGGLSTLEQAFDILGWENPHPVPECECEFDGCHEHATCGTPTKDGYKRVCGKHFIELQKEA